MNKVYTTIVVMLLSMIVLAQSPEMFSYQAIIRNSENNLIVNQQVGLQISILQGTDANSATSVYSETQTPATNANGLISIKIGTGTSFDDFSVIDWSTGTYFIKTETDPNGGTNYSITGTSQLLSVPYALHAQTVTNADDADSDITNELQILSLVGDTLFIEKGNYVILGGSKPLPSNTTIVSDEYAIDNSERTPTTWYNAVEVCAEAGGHLCSSSELYLACKQVSDGDITGITNLNNNWEWVWDGGPAGTWAANKWGKESCDAVSNGLATDKNAYRCCYNR